MFTCATLVYNLAGPGSNRSITAGQCSDKMEYNVIEGLS